MSLRHRHDDREGGQILVLFALSLVVILAFGSLLFTGANALVIRRQLQNAGDAAALAAANLIVVQNGCSASGSGGPPRAALVTAAKASVAANVPGYNASDVTVTCPTGYLNNAVAVALVGTSPAYFGVVSLNPQTSSTAINGQTVTADYSVALLDPSQPGWTSGGNRSGCASYLVNGGVTVTYEGSIMVDSTCTLATSNNGAVKAANGAFRMTMLNGAVLRIAGEASAGTAAHITPTPVENARPILKDPFGALLEPCHATSATCTGYLGTTSTLPARSAAKTGSGQCKAANSDPCVLLPGTYSGGILAANGSGAATLLLRPGVYYIAGGGLQLKSGAARIIGIPAATASCGGSTCTDNQARSRYATSLTDTQLALNWQADCPPPTAASTCGVMIYNAPADNSAWSTTGQSDQIQNGAQGVLLLRSYNPANDSTNGTTFASYKNLVMWQARTPAPSNTSAQPVIQMTGGACVVISGSVYASGAEVQFGGSSCGSGGGGDAVATLQFVAWDLTLSGNNNFYFAYQRAAFATPTAYGLIQ